MADLRLCKDLTDIIDFASGHTRACEQVDPVGEPFDPRQHEAMSMVPAPDAEPNSVVAVVQKGYTLNDRLVRPAMVVVAKAEDAPKIDEQA